jgi:hypothetical protein
MSNFVPSMGEIYFSSISVLFCRNGAGFLKNLGALKSHPILVFLEMNMSTSDQ